MKKIILILFLALTYLVPNEGFAQCDASLMNVTENFNTLPDPNNLAVLPACWNVQSGSAQMSGSGSVQLALLGSSTPGVLISPAIKNGRGVISFKARKTTSYTVYLTIGLFGSNAFTDAITYTLGSSYQTYTYDFSKLSSNDLVTYGIGFKITSGPNSGVQRLELDDIVYKSLCTPTNNPTAVAKNITVKLDATGNIIVNPSQVNNGSLDDCGEPITILSLDKTLFTCANLGANAVTLTATDSQGHTATATATITVEPTINIPFSNLSLPESGEIPLGTDISLSSSTTRCDAITYSFDKTNITCADLGSFVLTATATYTGGTTSVSRTIYIIDEVAPIATAQDISVTIDEASGIATITPEMLDKGSTDNCSIASMSISKSSFNCSDQGENKVILTVTDKAGRSDTVSATVTVNSFIPEVAVTTTNTSVCFDGTNGSTGATISTDNSTVGTQYYLRKSADSSIVDGPKAGTGSGLSFNTGAVSENTKFHVFAEIPFSGKALNVANSGGYLAVNTPATFNYTTGYTISAWIKESYGGISNSYNSLFYAGGAVGSDIEVYQNTQNGVISVVHNRGNTGTTSTYASPANLLPDGKYGHLTVTFDGTTSKIYINGVLKASSALVAPVKTAASELTFGYINNSAFPGYQSFGGSLDDIRVYDKALTSSAILNDFGRCLAGNEADLVLYYDMEALSGTIMTDRVSNTPGQLKGGGGALTSDGAISCSANCSRMMLTEITIGDNTAPTVITKNATITLPASGSITLTADMINDGSNDNCTDAAALKFALDVSKFTCSEIGTHPVTLTVTDGAGNSASATANVTVKSNIFQQSIISLNNTLCPNNTEGTTISTGSSQTGINYFLRNSANNEIVVGPIAGTGSALNFATGKISSNSKYNVFAQSPPVSSKALEFDGVDDRISIPADPSFNYQNGYTFEAWVNGPLTSSTKHYPLFFIGTTTTSDIEVYLQNGTNKLIVVHNRRSSGGITYNEYPTPPQNTWYHLSVTYDGSSINVYYDGIQKTKITGSTAGGALTKTSGATMTIGYVINNTAWGNALRNFAGKLDEIRIWNSVKTNADIVSNMNTCVDPTSNGLVSYYSLDEASGTVAKDLVKGNNGTLINMDDADWVSGKINCNNATCGVQMNAEIEINIEDTTPPTAIAQNLIAKLDVNNKSTITAAMVNNGSFDNCGNVSLSISVENSALEYPNGISYDETNLGANNVLLKVTDEFGNISTAAAIITIQEFKQDQTITFAALPNKNYGDADFDLIASVSSNLPVSFRIVSGPATLVAKNVASRMSEVVPATSNNSTLHITGAGTVIIEASQSGNDDFSSAQPVQQTLIIEKAQISVVAQDEQIVYGDPVPSFTLNYSGFVNGEDKSSFIAEPTAVAVLQGIELSRTSAASPNTALNAGTYTIKLIGGDAINYSFSLVNGTLTVAKAEQLITVNPIADKLTSDLPFEITASANSGLTITYTVSGPATISGNTITLNGTAGQVTITVQQAGDLNRNSASTSISFQVLAPLSSIASLEKTINIFPNPVDDFVTIQGDNIQSIKVFSLSGALLLDLKPNKEVFDLTHLMQGIYMIEIRTQKETIMKRLYKN
jgi:hypothetical protein